MVKTKKNFSHSVNLCCTLSNSSLSFW